MDQATALKNLTMENEDGFKVHQVEPTFHFVAHKSGMQNVDRTKMNAIILEASRGSRYYDKQMRRKQKCEEDIKKMKEKIEKTRKDKQTIQGIEGVIKNKIKQFEKERDLSRVWVHVDMDMFFVACEIRDRPELRNFPVAVGSIAYLNTANYVARQYGVITMMPGFIAKKLCPELIILPLDRDKYRATSTLMKQVIVEYDPEFESGGLDEAVLDLTDYLRDRNITTPEGIDKIIYDMRMKINDATGITCSCGIAPNKILAKLSTEINKPNGQYYMKPNREEILDFIGKLPVRKISGIGNIAEQILNGIEIKTCTDILERLVDLHIGFSEVTFDFLMRSSLGIGPYLHENPGDRKSYSVRKTPMSSVNKVSEMEEIVREIADDLSEGLSKMKKKTKHLTLMIKTIYFDERSKGIYTNKYTNSRTEIADICIKMLHEMLPTEPLRSIAVNTTNLINEEKLQNLDTIFKRMSSISSNKEETESILTEQEIRPILENDDEFDGNDEDEMTLYSELYTDKPDGLSRLSSLTSSTLENSNSAPIAKNLSLENQSLGSYRLKREDIVCPVCSMKFECSVNNSKINNHLDKCLLMSVQPSFPQEKHQENKKRKTKDESEDPHLGLKKTKKTPEVPGIMKLENFFTKK